MVPFPWLTVGLLSGILAFHAAPPVPVGETKDRPAVRPLSARDKQIREAKNLYGLAATHERGNRLLEAIKCYEQAEKLDPEASAIPRALTGLYIAMDRTEDALAACRKVLKLDPEDAATAFMMGRQLRVLERNKEAIEVLQSGVKSPRLKDEGELAAQMWFDLGVLHEGKQEWKQAEKCFREVNALLENSRGFSHSGKFTREELNSQASEILERIGKLCLKSGQVDEAIRVFESARKKYPDRAARLALHLAQVHKDANRPEKALEYLESYLGSQPQGIEAYEMKLSLQRKLGQEQAVVPGLEEAVRRDANNASLQILLAREYRKAGRPLPAEMLYRKLLEIHINPEVYRGLFELYREQGTAGAERILDLLNQAMDRGVGDEKRPPEPSDARRARAMLQVLRQDVGLVKMLLPLAIRRNGASNLAFATRGVLATLAAKTRQLPLAEQLYRSCLEGQGTRGGREAEIYVGLLRVLRLQHKNAEIVKLCQEGLKKAQKTNRVLFHTELCRAHQMLDDPEAGLKSADEAVQEAGKDQLLMCKRIRVDALFQAGKPDKALAECQEMLKEYPAGGELRDVRATMSTLLQAMGRFAEAEDQLQLILRTDPNDATANNDLGYLWADRNQRLPEAEAMIRKALELDRQQRNTGLAAEPDGDQDNAAYVDSLGWLLFRQGKIKEAIQILERASQLAGGDDDPVVWDHLGDAYSRDGNPEKASECWKKATSLYEQGARRKSDARYREIREKMKLVRN